MTEHRFQNRSPLESEQLSNAIIEITAKMTELQTKHGIPFLTCCEAAMICAAARHANAQGQAATSAWLDHLQMMLGKGVVDAPDLLQ